ADAVGGQRDRGDAGGDQPLGLLPRGHAGRAGRPGRAGPVGRAGRDAAHRLSPSGSAGRASTRRLSSFSAVSMMTRSALRRNIPSIGMDSSTSSVYVTVHVPSPWSASSYEPTWDFCTADGAASRHEIRVRSAAYSYASTYSSRTGPASSTNRTSRARPSGYSSTTSADRSAPVHSGYRSKSQITAAIRSAGAPIRIDRDEDSAMPAGYPSSGRPHMRRPRG